jgi:Kef-type K+ transport system membrane component KefB
LSATAVSQLLAALVIIIALARVFGAIARRLGQPPVVGEILVGVVLGPTFFGPGPSGALFPVAVVRPSLSGIGDVGLALFMFIIGYELDRKLVVSAGRATVSISLGSMILPLGLGVLLGFWLAGQQDVVVRHSSFALFIGTATAITAFPVLARILAERGMQRTWVGNLSLAAASVSDVLAWILLAIVVIVAKSVSASDWRLLVLPGYVLVMLLAVRPLMSWLARQRLRAGRLTPDMLVVIIVGLLASAYVTEWMGLNFIFGSFFYGALLPRGGVEQMRVEVLERVEQVCVLLLLPVYFVLAGLAVNLSGFSGRDGLDLAAILVVAIVGKSVGVFTAGRLQGIGRRHSAVLATLMNTRGLTEIVILTTGLQLGIIDVRVYSLMVVMALVTTAMAAPVLDAIYPKAMVARELAAADAALRGPRAAFRVLLALGAQASDQALIAAAGALAAARKPAEVIVAVVAPYRTPRLEVGGGIAEDMLGFTQDMARLETAREGLAGRGIVATPTARLAADPAGELAQIASAADAMVISADHPYYQAAAAAANVPVVVTVGPGAPSSWSAVAVQAGTGADASATAEVVRLLAAGAQVIVDPVGLSGRGLDRFTDLLGDADRSTQITGEIPGDVLIVARPGAPRAGAHLIVRAGPRYTPAEPAALVGAGLGQEDR